MMDSSNLLPADGLEAVHQNGVHEELSNSAKDIETIAPNEKSENMNHSDSTANNSSVAEIKEGSHENMDSNNVTMSKEEEVEIIDQTEQLRAQKGSVKSKNAKPPSPRGVHASSGKKSRDGKDEEASSVVSNGTSTLDSHAKQPIKNKSLNDKHNRLSKHPGKSDPASSEAQMEKTKVRLLKKGPPDNLQGEAESSFPTAEDAKPRRVGTLPNYGFSFKCNERAERRREFYSKLEEKIHAKEVEESNLQAKTKETQEAEIKMLRKSLGFKATPMPSFYQEPPPPRTELKKIPTTRPKSPKLGRRKSSTFSEPEGNTSSKAQQGRLSLDEKVSQSNPAKGISPIHQKKPQRKSLPPRLTSERNSSSNSATAQTSSKAVNDEKDSLSSGTTEVSTLTLSNVTEEEKVEMAGVTDENALSNETSEALLGNAEPSEAESRMNGNIVIEEKPQFALVPEAIVAEH